MVISVFPIFTTTPLNGIQVSKTSTLPDRSILTFRPCRTLELKHHVGFSPPNPVLQFSWCSDQRTSSLKSGWSSLSPYRMGGKSKSRHLKRPPLTRVTRTFRQLKGKLGRPRPSKRVRNHKKRLTPVPCSWCLKIFLSQPDNSRKDKSRPFRSKNRSILRLGKRIDSLSRCPPSRPNVKTRGCSIHVETCSIKFTMLTSPTYTETWRREIVQSSPNQSLSGSSG